MVFKKGQIAWNKGLTKETDERIKILTEKREGWLETLKLDNKKYDAWCNQISESRKGKYVGKNNPFYGKHHTKESIKKMLEKKKGFKHSKKTKKLMSLAQKGPKHHMFGKHHTKETKEKLREVMKKFRHTEKGKEKIKKASIKLWTSKKHIQNMSIKMGGKNNPMYGKPSPHGKWIKYKGIHFRSSWEVIYARWLDKMDYHWKYEPKRFYFEKFTYLPDFWVDELNSYIEVKGWMDRHEIDKEKIKLFSKNHHLILIDDIKKYGKEVEIDV